MVPCDAVVHLIKASSYLGDLIFTIDKTIAELGTKQKNVIKGAIFSNVVPSRIILCPIGNNAPLDASPLDRTQENEPKATILNQTHLLRYVKQLQERVTK